MTRMPHTLWERAYQVNISFIIHYYRYCVNPLLLELNFDFWKPSLRYDHSCLIATLIKTGINNVNSSQKSVVLESSAKLTCLTWLG